MKNKLYIYFFVTLLFFGNIHVFALNNLSGNITSDWKDGFCYNFTLNNTSGKEISDWKIYFKLDANTLLTSQRSGNFSHNGNDYTITPVEWNKNISSNSKIDIGFCANGISRPFDITTISDNVIAEKPVVSVPETPQIPIIPENNSLQNVNLNKDGLNVSFSTTSKRDGGYCRNITLKNTSNKTISNWEISFILDQAISGWSAQYSKNGTKYTVKSMDWNKNIDSNSQTEIGFCSIGKLYDKIHVIENIFFTNPAPIPVLPIQPTVPTNPTHSGSTDEGVLLKYPTDSWNPKSVDLNGDNKKDYILSLNPWNIAKADGTATMSVDTINKKIIYNQDLTNIVIKDAGSYVLSYPEVYVGNKPWGGEYFETNSKLPAKFSDLNDLQLKVNYKANFENGLHANIAMEGWLTKNKLQTTGVGFGESEVMVWLYSNGLNPAGKKIGEVILNLKVNGVNKNEIFEIYKGNIGWEIISYRPKNGGWNSADIELNLKQIFDNFKTNTSNSNYDNLYLQGWEFGTETGSPTTTKAKYNWELSQYDVTGILKSIDTNPTNHTTPTHSGISIPSSNLFIGYYPSRARYAYPYDKIDYSKFDIINHAFVFPSETTGLKVDADFLYPELVKSVHLKGKKILLTVGNVWGDPVFGNVMIDNMKKEKFISTIVDFVIKNNYDGVDIDREFPNSQIEGVQYIALLKEIKNRLPGKLITTAISIFPSARKFDILELSKTVDYINIMAYDMEAWEGYAGYNAPLYKNSKMPIDYSIDTFIKNDFSAIDAKKIILGFPLYGRKFNVAEPYMKAYSSETIEYKDLPKNCIDKWDSESKVPYLSCGSYYISYDNIYSLDEKIKYANNKLLGGVFVWAIGQDNGEIIKTLDTSNIQQSISTPILTITSQSKISPTEKIQTSTIDIGISKKINASLDTFIVKNKVNLPTKLIQIKTKLKILQQKYKNDIKKLSIVNLYMEIIDKKISELK